MFVLGKKLKMKHVWQEGKAVPVTEIHVEPNKVFIVRTSERDGYEGSQIGVGRHKRETRILNASNIKKDEIIDVSVFEPGDTVRVSGNSKGRGFQGVVKRHGFHGGPKTHGQKNRHRAPGSIGSTAPQRVWPGRRMAGRMGGDRVTVKNVLVVDVDKDHNTLLIKGQAPGTRGSILEIEKMK